MDRRGFFGTLLGASSAPLIAATPGVPAHQYALLEIEYGWGNPPTFRLLRFPEDPWMGALRKFCAYYGHRTLHAYRGEELVQEFPPMEGGDIDDWHRFARYQMFQLQSSPFLKPGDVIVPSEPQTLALILIQRKPVVSQPSAA